jgi:hypothetical protein
MPAPDWADRIVREVARARRRPAPALHWRRSRRRRSAGSADSYMRKHPAISVVAGRDVVDQRLILLHELAHWLGPPGEGHSMAFWIRAWKLFRRYRVPVHYALAREGAYEGAVQAYKKSLNSRR